MLPVVESKELACTVGYEFSGTVVLVNLWFIILLCLAML